MKSIFTLLFISLLPLTANAQDVYNCIAGAAAPTPNYVACPQDLRPLVGEASSTADASLKLAQKGRDEIARLRRNAKGNADRIAALEAAIKVLEARSACNIAGDPAASKACYESKANLARALRGEAVALAAVNRGPVRLEIAQGAGSDGTPGYYFELEAPPPSTSPLQAAVLDARLKLASDEDLQPIDHLGALGAVGFTLGGALIGGAMGYGFGSDGSTETLDDGTVEDVDSDNAKTSAIGAAIGAGSGLVLYGITEGIIALTNSSRAETRRRLVATPGGMAVAF